MSEWKKKPEVLVGAPFLSGMLILERSDDPELVREVSTRITGRWDEKPKLDQLYIPGASASEEEKIEQAEAIAVAFIEAGVDALMKIPGMTRKLALGELAFRTNQLHRKAEYEKHEDQNPK